MKSLDPSFYNLTRMLVGQSEAIEADHAVHSRAMHGPSRLVIYYGVATDIFSTAVTRAHRALYGHHHHHHHAADMNNNATTTTNNTRSNSALIKRIERLLDSFNKSDAYKHTLCTHRYNCGINAGVGFTQRFLAGYVLQAAVKCIGSLPAILRRPHITLPRILLAPVNAQLGMFLGSYALIFRAISCLLKWLTGRNVPVHGLVSGFFAGWSMLFYKSSSIALYLSFKLLEVLFFSLLTLFSLSLFFNNLIIFIL
jgi:hypothetical protein